MGMSGPRSGECKTCGAKIAPYDSYAEKGSEMVCFDCFWSDLNPNRRGERMDGIRWVIDGGPYDGFQYWTDG